MIIKYLPYTLSLQAPAVLTSLRGDPNSLRTLLYIPGSTLRGFAAQKLNRSSDDANFREFIFNGTVRFLNAYPCTESRRTLPTPVSWRIDKHRLDKHTDTINSWDLAAFDKDSTWPAESLSVLPEPFITIGAARPCRVTPTLGSRIHQQRDRSYGHAWKEICDRQEKKHGEVFSIEFLESDQDFDGLIQIQAENEHNWEKLAQTIKDILQPPILIGRSRRGGYGGNATITWRKTRDREVDGQGLIQADLSKNFEFQALLTSNYIGRNQHTGQIDPAYLVTEIEEVFEKNIQIIRECLAFELVGGFNRKWRLEIPQTLTCSAGSVLILKTKTPIFITTLQSIENAGLGERRADGFGRVVFLNVATQAPIEVWVPTVTTVQEPNGDPPEIVHFVERRIIDAAVERIIQEEATRLARDAIKLPTASIIGRLRNAIRSPPHIVIKTLSKWLSKKDDDETSKLKKPAITQLDRCRIGEKKKPLSDWLREHLKNEDNSSICDTLRLEVLAQRHCVLSNESATKYLKSNERMLLTCVRLIDSTLAALARKQRQARSS